MDTYVYIIHRCCFCQILLKILHVCYQKILFTCKILIDLSIFIEDMNDYNLLLLFARPNSCDGSRLVSCPRMLMNLWQSLHSSLCLWFLCVLWSKVLLLGDQIRLSFLWGSVKTFLIGVLNISESSLLVGEPIQYVSSGGLLSCNCSLILHRIWIGYLQLSSLAFIRLNCWSLDRLGLMNNTPRRVAFRRLYQFIGGYLLLLLLLCVRCLHNQIISGCICVRSTIPKHYIIKCIISCSQTASSSIGIALYFREINMTKGLL